MKSKKEKLSPQAERTKHHLQEAYIELINEKGYSHVSVTDIVQRAQYNRATFYLYYLDKPDLTEELLREMFQQIKRTSTERYEKGADILTSSMNADSFELISFVYDNRSFFNLYLVEDTIPGLHGELPQAILRCWMKGLPSKGSAATISIPSHSNCIWRTAPQDSFWNGPKRAMGNPRKK